MKAFIVLFVFVALAAATPRIFLQRETPLEKPSHWVHAVHVPADLHSTRSVVIKVWYRNRDLLEQTFWDIATPGHENFRQFLTLDEFAEKFGPSEETVEKVTNWLDNFDVEYEVSLSRDSIFLKRLPLLKIEKMFNVTFSTFIHSVNGHIASATLDAYSVPAEFKDIIALVSPISGLPDVVQPKRTHERPNNGLDITPAIIWQRYNISSSLQTNPTNGNKHAVAEFQAQYYSPTDLQTFFKNYNSQVPKSNGVGVAKVIGTNVPTDPTGEGSLDVQYIMGVAPNITTWFYSNKNFNFYSDLTQWLSTLQNEPSIPWVHSVSYGSQGGYPDPTYEKNADDQYKALGVRGASIIYASGDRGAECVNNCKVMEASYPATSVYVTAIGSTKFINGNTGAEAATAAFKSGGGFAQDFARPDYQSKAVPAYFQSGVKFPPAGTYHAQNRGNPDFAALGAPHFQVIIDGFDASIGGTSAAAPTFGAIVSLLNDELLTAKKKPLGFLNTQFYQLAESNPNAFFDVTVGNNYLGCGNTCANGVDGFNTARGWDAVSGYGTPNYPELLKYVRSMN